MIDARFFQFKGPFRVSELAKTLSVEFQGEDKILMGAASLKQAKEGDLACCHQASYVKELETSTASVCIVHPNFAPRAPKGMTLFISEKPYRLWAKCLKILYKEPQTKSFISPSAYVDESALLGEGVTIEPFSYIGKNVKIGANTVVKSHATLEDGVEVGKNCVISFHVSLSNSVIGNDVYIKPGARIGQQGFGFDMDEMGPFDILQLGRVIIKDNVVIGSNTTIDRGAGPDTVIGTGVRIDNLVQVAHNAVIGDYCVMVAQSGIAGSSTLQNYVVVAGQVGIAGHLTIGAGARIAAQSGVMRDVAPQETVAGTPCVPVRDWHKQTIALAKLIKKKEA